MKRLYINALLLSAFVISAFTAKAQSAEAGNALYKEILHMDSVLFNAYNKKDITVLKEVFSKDLEFYHDKGGVSNYEHNIEAFKGLFARVPDLHRQLVTSSMEVYPIKDYGAIQTGLHRFCHKENGKEDCGTFKFVNVWKKTPEGWKLARVMSYNH